MNLVYHESFGSVENPALVLLHGWGMSSTIWTPLLPALTQSFYVTVIDLPGLGRSTSTDDITLESMAAKVAALIEQPAYWLGWSLGGLLAIKIASSYPEKVKGLMSVSSNPCFVQREDWRCAMSPIVYQQFKAALKVSPEKTLSRFAMLQIQGSESAKVVLKQIKLVLADIRNSDHSSSIQLLATLILLENDLRAELSQLRCPVLHIYGEEDSIVPISTATAVKALNPQHQIISVKASGHLPFLSSPDIFLQSIRSFIQTMNQQHG